MRKDRLSKKEWMYVAFCFVVYFLWAAAFLTWNYGPDEYMRIDIPKFICEYGKLPYGNEEVIRNSIWGFSYGYLITFPYLLGALFMKITSFLSDSQYLLWLSVRMVSVLSTTGITYYAIKISKRILSEKTRWIFIVMMSLLPEIVFVGSYFNNDSFGLFTAVMIVYAWICCMESIWDTKSCVRLGIANGLCLLGYRFYWSFVLCSLFLYIASFAKYHKEQLPFKTFLKKGFLILGIVLLICGWVYIRALILYQGDIFGSAHAAMDSELYAEDGYRQSQVIARSLQANGMGISYMLFHTSWLVGTLTSLFYGLGYLSVIAPNSVYLLYGLICLIGLLAFFVRLIKQPFGFGHTWVIIMMILAGLITFSLSVYSSWSGDFQAQGRYVMGVLPAIFLTVSIGFEGILMKKLERWKSISVLGICFYVVMTMMLAFFHCQVAIVLP